MIGDPKKVALGIIAKLHPKDGAGDPPQDMEDHGGEKQAIAQELIHAVHGGDAGAVVDAFEALFHAMEMEPHEEVDHAEEDAAPEMMEE